LLEQIRTGVDRMAEVACIDELKARQNGLAKVVLNNWLAMYK
jgi:hypothetical protein